MDVSEAESGIDGCKRSKIWKICISALHIPAGASSLVSRWFWGLPLSIKVWAYGRWWLKVARCSLTARGKPTIQLHQCCHTKGYRTAGNPFSKHVYLMRLSELQFFRGGAKSGFIVLMGLKQSLIPCHYLLRSVVSY